MELSYWLSRWRKNKIGFHMPEGYPVLSQHLSNLEMNQNRHVLVPLCGKSLDLVELTKHFDHVTGVEISEKAIQDFFEEHRLKPSEKSYAEFKIFETESVSIWRGDFLKLPVHKVPDFDLIYDKAALVALPAHKRSTYAEKLLSVTSSDTHILLHHFIYAQDEMPGPPFSVSNAELDNYFGPYFTTNVLEQKKLDLNQFEKFKKRGLKSGLTEQLLHFRPKK